MKTCGECKHFEPGMNSYDEILGKIHFCNKERVCNSWDLKDNCEGFEDIDLKDLLKEDIEYINHKEDFYAKLCRDHKHYTEAEVVERRKERIIRILKEKLNDLQSN